MSRKHRGVVGFDLSLRRPAGCYIPPGWSLGNWADPAFRCEAYEPQREVRDEDHAELRADYRRLIKIAGWARDFVLMHKHADGCEVEVFVEQYAFSRSSSSVTRLAELGGVVRVELFTYGMVVREPIVASHARRLLLGKLPGRDAGRGAAKVAVEVALTRVGACFEGDDECDAFAVANAGLSEIGMPFLSLA